jgi:hypothetical protein
VERKELVHVKEGPLKLKTSATCLRVCLLGYIAICVASSVRGVYLNLTFSKEYNQPEQPLPSNPRKRGMKENVVPSRQLFSRKPAVAHTVPREDGFIQLRAPSGNVVDISVPFSDSSQDGVRGPGTGHFYRDLVETTLEVR